MAPRLLSLTMVALYRTHRQMHIAQKIIRLAVFRSTNAATKVRFPDSGLP